MAGCALRSEGTRRWHASSAQRELCTVLSRTTTPATILFYLQCQRLDSSNFRLCFEFCQRMIGILDGNKNAVLLMSDESHIHLDGFVNKHNLGFRKSLGIARVAFKQFSSDGVVSGR